MVKKKGVYKSSVDNTIVEALWDGDGELMSGGQPLEYLEANTVDAAKEKHVPVIERDGQKVTVKVGEVEHPMTPEHYILFAELVVGNKVYRQDFKEGDHPVATFLVDESETDLLARAYCNLHGFWASK